MRARHPYMHMSNNPQFIRFYSCAGSGRRGTITNCATPESVLLARLAEDVLAWVDSSWVIGLIRSDGGIGITAVFAAGSDPDIRRGYLEAVCSQTLDEESETRGALPRLRNVAEVVFPIRGDCGVDAILGLGPRQDRRRYSAADTELVRELCARFGSLFRKRQPAGGDLSGDVETARGIQERIEARPLISAAHPVDGIECCGQCQRRGRPGGDFFDLFPSGGRELIAAIGNTGTTGAGASILTTSLQSCLRSLGGRGVELPVVMTELNRMLWEIAPENVYTSLFASRIDPHKHELRYANAGHQMSLLIKSSGTVERLDVNGAVLGLSRRSLYRERAVAFQPGDILVAVSDGIVEAVTPGGTELTEHGVLKLIRHSRCNRFQDLPASILSAVEGFADNDALDRTVVAVRHNDASAQYLLSARKRRRSASVHAAAA
jgi:serine phosphatase RsbU (regulator of sigma subunit)